MEYVIREMREEEFPLLKDFTYKAIFLGEGDAPPPRDIVEKPRIRLYHENFGKKDDLCLVAEVSGQIAGAVWTRILAGAEKGYGNIDDETPEFSISLHKQYRNAGIGFALMRAMLERLRKKGYPRASLSVQKENYAARLYEKVGFRTVCETDEDFIMVCDLSEG